MPAAATKCPSCQHSFAVPGYMIGRPVTCPSCKHQFHAAADQPALVGEAKASPPPADGSQQLAAAVPPMTAVAPLPGPEVNAPAAPAPAAVSADGPSLPRPLAPATTTAPYRSQALAPQSDLLAYLALVLGLLGFAVGWVPQFGVLGLGLGGLGLLLGVAEVGLGTVRRERRGVALAATAVCVQAVVLAAVLTYAPPRGAPAGQAPPAPPPPPTAETANLRDALRQTDPKERAAAAAAVAKRSRDAAS